jgi:hypothetical protein
VVDDLGGFDALHIPEVCHFWREIRLALDAAKMQPAKKTDKKSWQGGGHSFFCPYE